MDFAQICFRCGSKLKESARFCGQCGAKQADDNNMGQMNRNNASDSSVASIDSVHARAALMETLFITSDRLKEGLQELIDSNEVTRDNLFIVKDIDACHDSARAYLAHLLKKKNIRYVVIFGGWGDVPPFELNNPAFDVDDEEFCLSDAPYGLTPDVFVDDLQSHVPKITVSRVPELDKHKLRQVLMEPVVTISEEALFHSVVTAQCWSDPTQQIVNALDLPSEVEVIHAPGPKASTGLSILSSPEWDDVNFGTHVAAHPIRPSSLLLFNVHGSADEPIWMGEGGKYVFIHRPGLISDYAKSILITEACYGGALGYDSTSIVEDFFERNGKAFMGCSVIAYGAVDSDITAADIMALSFANGVLKGDSLGDSFQKAKQTVLESCEDEPEFGLKTVLSFNLYGAPWHRLQVQKMHANSAGLLSSREGALQNLRERIKLYESKGSDALKKYRKQYRASIHTNMRRKLLSSEESKVQMNQFRDRDRINSTLDRWRSKYPKYKISIPEDDSIRDYRIVCSTNGDERRQDLRVIVLDGNGCIKKMVSTKGVDHEM